MIIHKSPEFSACTITSNFRICTLIACAGPADSAIVAILGPTRIYLSSNEERTPRRVLTIGATRGMDVVRETGATGGMAMEGETETTGGIITVGEIGVTCHALRTLT